MLGGVAGLAFTAAERRFRRALAAAAGLPAERFERPGTVVVPTPARSGSGVAAAYRVGELTLVWCDPAVEGRVAGLADPRWSFPVERLEGWAAGQQAEFVGGAWSHLVDRAMLASPAIPPGAGLRLLDRTDPTDRAHLAGLLDACDPDDVEVAEVAMDDLDHLIVGAFGGDGPLAGMASERPWEHDRRFGDIAVLVHPGHRGAGIGRAVVARLCREDFRRHRLPLYRCNWDRTASRRLALSLGFAEVLSLAAVRFG